MRRLVAKVLEVGNVLPHYYPAENDIVDKFERGPCILNVDIVSKDEALAGRCSQSVSLCERATGRGVWNCLMNLRSIEPNP